MSNSKPDATEMYCSDCGEIIKEKAEICPECGVRKQPPSPEAGNSKSARSGNSGSSSSFSNYLGNYYTGRGVWGYTLAIIDISLGVSTVGAWLLGRWGIMYFRHSSD